MSHLMNTLVASSLLATSTIKLNATEKPLPWTPEAMMTTTLISDVQLSPDNKSVLFVATEAVMTGEKGSSLSRIYKGNSLNTENAVPFSSPNSSSMQPRWSPNGEWIAFLSTRDGVKDLYLIRSEGGEIISLTKSKKDIQTYAWSPDGKQIAFVMADQTEKDKSQLRTSLAYVYKQNNPINRLWVIDVFSIKPTPRPLTTDEYSVRGSGDFGTLNVEFDWSPDSKEILFAHSPSIGFDHFHLDSSLATVNLLSGITTPLEKKARFEAMPRFSPDGQWIAYLSNDSPEKYAINRQLAIRSLKKREHRLLVQTFDEGAFLAGPNFLGWTQDSSHLLFFEPKGTKFHLVLLPIDGKSAKEVETGDLFFRDPSLSPDKTMLGFIVQTPSTPPEAYTTSLSNFKPLQVSALNQSLFAYPQIDTKTVSWKSKDGMEIEGLLTYPVDYQKDMKYPLLLVVHGGPMAFFDETFIGTPTPYPLAAFAQAGFVILRPNPRGSCGYGKSFRSANYKDWGGMDFVDLMTGVDALIAKGIVDADRLGIMGWSYGGYMTAWTITQTSRFKAASMGAGPCNLVSMNGTTDLHRFLTDYLGEFSKNPKLYTDRSPINHLSNVKTPCLIQHGVEDKRVPVTQAYEFYHALERASKECTLVLYPGMEHRLADPKMQLDAMKRNLEWFQLLVNSPL